MGRDLYDRLSVFAGHFAKTGRGLDTAVTAYNQAVGSFQSRLLPTARKFPEYGVTNDVLPEVTQIDRPRELVALPQPDANADAA